jgi:hydroxyethylthiazole kinase-like uncharacterized protein yjeF
MLPSPPGETRLDATVLAAFPLPDNDHDDKRHRGTVMVIGGSVETPGAALLAGVAALRMGAGRLQIASAAPVLGHLGVSVPEALVIPYDDVDAESLCGRIAVADAVVVGPGLSDADHAADLLAAVLENASPEAIVVVDAMGLDALRAVPARPANSAPVIVTPNREELARLGRDDAAGSSPEAVAAREHDVTVVSFGRIAVPDGRCWVDDGAVTGLGTSGAGDILAGAVGGVAARSHDVPTAALWAALTHRIAANRVASAIAPVGYLAREVVDELPRALGDLDELVRRSG